MARKKKADESWGPFYETYIKNDPSGVEFEQEVPVYMEVTTPHGIFGVPAKHKMHLEITETSERTVITPVYTLVKSAKSRKPKKVVEDSPATEE